jgi:hypothetical protein
MKAGTKDAGGAEPAMARKAASPRDLAEGDSEARSAAILEEVGVASEELGSERVAAGEAGVSESGAESTSNTESGISWRRAGALGAATGSTLAERTGRAEVERPRTTPLRVVGSSESRILWKKLLSEGGQEASKSANQITSLLYPAILL